MRTNRTYAVFTTEADRAGGVDEETLQAHARAILEPVRETLITSGRTATAVTDHNGYGVAFTVHDPSSGGNVYVLLQAGWLLTLRRELSLVDRLRGRHAEEVDETLLTAIDRALASVGTAPVYWCTNQEYTLRERTKGPAFRVRGARKPKDISLHIYSSSPPVESSLIQSTCLDPSLPIDLRWEVALRGAATQRVWGWRPQSADASRIQAAVEANDQPALDEHYARDSVASVDVRVLTKEDEDWSATMGQLLTGKPAKGRHEDLSDFVSRMDAWHKFRDFMGKVETRYTLSTPADRNATSLAFQCDLWRVIGVLANGVMQDETERVFPVHDQQ